MEFVFKYTGLKLDELIGKDEQFIFKHYGQLGSKASQSSKPILDELLEQLIYEDKLNQTILYQSLYDYEQQELLSKKVLANLDDSNVIKVNTKI